MDIGDIVQGFDTIKWGEETNPEDVVYPGLKRALGIIIRKNVKAKMVQVLVSGQSRWWYESNTTVINDEDR